MKCVMALLFCLLVLAESKLSGVDEFLLEDDLTLTEYQKETLVDDEDYYDEETFAT